MLRRLSWLWWCRSKIERRWRRLIRCCSPKMRRFRSWLLKNKKLREKFKSWDEWKRTRVRTSKNFPTERNNSTKNTTYSPPTPPRTPDSPNSNSKSTPSTKKTKTCKTESKPKNPTPTPSSEKWAPSSTNTNSQQSCKDSDLPNFPQIKMKCW